MTNDPSKSKATGRSGELIPPELGKRPENRIQPPDQRPDRRNEVREPIFGAGAGSFLGQLIITALALGLILIVLLLASAATEKTSGLLFGKPSISRIVPQDLRP
jgi:hypothetical protein